MTFKQLSYDMNCRVDPFIRLGNRTPFILSLYLISETDNFPLHFTETDITNNKARTKESLPRVSITIKISFFAVCQFLSGR